MRLRSAIAGVALAAAGGSLPAQERIAITDLGSGEGGRALQEALARPHRIVAPDTGTYILRRGVREPAGLVVLGRDAAIAASVDGDVIVVGGDLFIRPGARVSGRAVAIGGRVYRSALGFVERGTSSFYDHTYDIFRTTDGYRLDYRALRERASTSVRFPGLFGLRGPEYDRVNGVSVGFGPAFAFMKGSGEVHTVGTYRSDLGLLDPSLYGTLQLGRRVRAGFGAERGTFTNEGWIWPTLVNSFSVLGTGRDTRNYYRADRMDVLLSLRSERPNTRFEPFVGARTERAWSVGPVVGEDRGPWSLFGRTDSLGMRRPNPPITDGTITSLLAGGALSWRPPGMRLVVSTRGELSLTSPVDDFVQIVSDLDVEFTTFGSQVYALEVHWVMTPDEGGPPPAQRFHWLGGAGTLSFLDLLAQGGDELLYIEQRYSVPLTSIRLGFLGSPAIQLQHRMGSAGPGALPEFEQVIGAGVALALWRGEIRAEFRMDPASRSTEFGFGIGFRD